MEICWEKYENPYLTSLEINPPNQDDREYYDEEPEEDKTEQQELLHNVVHTNYGPIAIPNIYIDNGWNLWTGHTRKKITVEIANKIEDTDGVEVLQILSPYRFMISIALHPSFSPGMVMAEVAQNAFGVELPIAVELQHRLEQNISSYKEKIIRTGNPHWFIFAFPNGKVISKNSAEESEKYLKALSIVNDLKGKINGVLITNKD